MKKSRTLLQNRLARCLEHFLGRSDGQCGILVDSLSEAGELLGQLGCVDGRDGIVKVAQLGPLGGGNEVSANPMETVTTDTSQKGVEGLRCVMFPGVLPVRDLVFVAQRKLAQLDAAATLDFLRVPPGNRLESLKGERQGFYSIRINDQWRLCFRFRDGSAFDVEIVDYD